MITIIVFILVLGFLIFIHELGHYLAARAVGVEVQEFSIGFPPQLYSKVVKGTRYILSAIPIGGYVKMKGQNLDDEDPSDPTNYAAKTISQRFLILFAGSGMNFLVALIFTPLVLYLGANIPKFLTQPAVIYQVASDSPAKKAGLRAGDHLVQVNGHSVGNWQDVRVKIAESESEMIQLQLKRDGRILEATLPIAPLRQGKAIGWQYYIEPDIGSLSSNGPAEKAGLKIGDRLLSINGNKISVWDDIPKRLQNYKEGSVQIQYQREKQVRNAELTPIQNQEGRWIIGVGTPVSKVSKGFSDAISEGTAQVFRAVKLTFGFLAQLISGQASSDSVGGPIMIASMVGKAAQSSLTDLLSLVGFISLQLSIFNLLPIPALDGGHILFLLFEKVKGSALSKNFRVSSQKVGFIILLSLILYVSIQDGLKFLPI